MITANELMSMHICEWPTALHEYVIFVGGKLGHCGDVFYECCVDYINAGKPNTSDYLILMWHIRTGII